MVVLAMVLGVAARSIPLQHYIPLSRYQHWAIALLVWSLGFFIQTVWSWRKLTISGRVALLTGGVYVCSAALVMYFNPWLDTSISLQTTEQEAMRIQLGFGWAGAGLVVGMVWMRWGLQELARLDEQDKKTKAQTDVSLDSLPPGAFELGGGD